MDYMPYEMSKMNNSSTLVIGSGGGEDILVALSAGSKNVTAVELNPLIVSAVKQYGGSSAGNCTTVKMYNYLLTMADDLSALRIRNTIQ